MFEMKDEMEMKQDIKQSMDQLTAPESLKAFARDIALHSEKQNIGPLSGRKRPWMGFAACAAAAGILLFTAQVSPAFANMIKNIPGVSVAADWLDSIRSRDGVENAAGHQYMPFEPVVQEFGDVKVSLADVYLTSDKLMYKAFIRSGDIKKHLIQNPDGSQGLDRTADLFTIHSLDFHPVQGGGRQEIIFDKETQEPVLVASYVMELTSQEVEAFLNGNPNTLRFKLYVTDASKHEPDHGYAMNVPFEPSQWMEDRVIPVHHNVEVAGDPDIGALVLENLKITPLNTYVELRLDNANDYALDIDLARSLEQDTIKLTDNNGKVYPLDTYRPKYPPTNEKHQSGVIELSFNSSPFFDETVKSLTLLIAGVEVSDRTEGSTFRLALEDKLPKTIHFKDKEMIITEAQYEEGFLKVKVLQKAEDRMKIRFDIPEFMKKVADSPALREEYYVEKISLQKGLLIPAEGQAEHELSIAASDEGVYEIRMKREQDEVQINQTIEIDIRNTEKKQQ